MDRMTLGLLCGLGFGALTVLIMLLGPVKWESPRQKQEAMIAAFFGRFMTGLLIPLAGLVSSPILNGILISFGISLSPAIIARRYAPILISAVVGGAIIGWISGLPM